jgi:hypothetical protein
MVFLKYKWKWKKKSALMFVPSLAVRVTSTHYSQNKLFNPLTDGPRSNLTQGFQRLTAQSIKELKIWKKLQLSDII